MAAQWPVPVPVPHRPRRRLYALLVVGIIANTALSTVALVMGLSQSGANLVPTYTAAQKATAQTQLCSRYRLAAQAARIETSSGDVALARISTTNGALILETAAADPALDSAFRDAALALATAYRTMTVKQTEGMADDTENQAVLDAALDKNRAMKDLCDN